MKQTMTTAIALCALLAASCAFAQGRLGGRLADLQSDAQPPQEIYEKVPEAHRDSVRSAIATKARDTADSEVVERFDVIISRNWRGSSWAWTNNCGKGVVVLGDSFSPFMCRRFSADGHLLQVGTKDTFEELKWRDKRRDELILSYWNDPAFVAAAISNSVAVASNSTPRIVRQPRPPRRLLERPSPRLEERIPIEEAMALAKEGEGKGFYQLALSYSIGDGLPEDQETACKMLQRACAANYANAILVEGMCDERDSFGPLQHFFDLETEIQKYCCSNYYGAVFHTERTGRYDESSSLTNAAAFARVMGKYERAKELGALAATNQIAALNRRLAEFRKKESETEQANENDRRVKEMLGEDAPKAGDENQD